MMTSGGDTVTGDSKRMRGQSADKEKMNNGTIIRFMIFSSSILRCNISRTVDVHSKLLAVLVN